MLRELLFTLAYYAVPLALTILIEAGAAYLCGLKQKEEQHALLLCNLLTNPLLNLILYIRQYAVGSPFPFPVLLLFEALVAFAEGCMLRCLCEKRRRYFALSLLFNAISYGAGLLLSRLLF